MTAKCKQLLAKISAVDDSFLWIEKQADDLLLEFEVIMEKFQCGENEPEDYEQIQNIERRMTELENRAKINTNFYNAAVDEARLYFKQYYNSDLPPSIRKLI